MSFVDFATRVVRPFLHFPTSTDGASILSIRTCFARISTFTGARTGWLLFAIAMTMPLQVAAADLTITRSGTGAGTVSSSPAGISCGGDCYSRYPKYSIISLTAAPASGSIFAGWSGGCAGNTASTAITLKTRSTTCNANFALATSNQFTLTVSRAGTGLGSVSSTPGGISCGNACSSSYLQNSAVILVATASSGSTFAGWSGACTGTGTSTSIAVTSNATCIATFSTIPTPQYTLTVSRAGTGTGTVNSAPAGIVCGSVCAYSFAQGTSVALTATPAAGSTFTGWSGSCAGTVASTSIVVNVNSTCTATFAATPPSQFSLIITRTGTGSGTVTSTPAGIACGSVCSYNFTQSTTIALSAVPAAGSAFTGWSGSCAGTGTGTSIVLSANSICFANFALNAAPSGSASLTWDPVTDAALSGYRVYFGTAPGAYLQAAGQGLNAGNSTAFALTGLNSGTRYYFAVTAYSTVNLESAFSNEAVKDMP